MQALESDILTFNFHSATYLFILYQINHLPMSKARVTKIRSIVLRHCEVRVLL